MNPKPDAEGYIGLFEEESPEVSPAVNTAAPGNGGRMELGTEGRKILGELIEVKPEEEWAGNPIPAAWNKIRSAFLQGRTAFDIKAFSKSISDGAWLELALKMAPKQIEVNSLQITTVRIELPPKTPIDVDIIDIEVPV